MVTIEHHEVVGLQEHVGELGKGDPLFTGLETVAHRVALDHRVDREVLADVAQETQQVDLAEPIEVVDHLRRVGAVEVEKAGQLPMNCLGVGSHRVIVEQDTLLRLAARITDQAGTAADQRDRPMSGQLQPSQRQDGQQRADVKTRT